MPRELPPTSSLRAFARAARTLSFKLAGEEWAFGLAPARGAALHSGPILDLDFSPVCRPALAGSAPPLHDPADLADHTLIHVAQTPDAWAQWLRAAGVAFDARRAVTYD